VKFLPEILKVKYSIGNNRFTVPKDFLYKEACELFRNPDLTRAANTKLEWTEPNKAVFIKYMVDKKGFQKERIERGIQRIKESKKGSEKRLVSFYGPVTNVKER